MQIGREKGMKDRQCVRDRINRLRLLMLERRMEALLVTRRENVQYLTGFTGSSGSVLVSLKRLLLVTDFRYMLQAGAEAPGVSLAIQKKEWASTIKKAAERIGAGRLWFDESGVTVEAAGRLKKAGLAVKGAPDIVAELRQKKDEAELSAIRRAILRAEESFLEIRRLIRPGATERDIAIRLEYLMRSKGARRQAFETIVASGTNGAMPHASTTARCIRQGDLVTIDFGAEADGYYCDITRTVCAGRPTKKQREVHGIVQAARQAAIDSIRPGTECSAVDAVARRIIKKAGYGRYFGHATGHGVGLMVHEGPVVSARSRSRMDAGMVVTIEPGIYIPGWGGVRIEDMVLVTDTGAEVLTSLPRDLL